MIYSLLQLIQFDEKCSNKRTFSETFLIQKVPSKYLWGVSSVPEKGYETA